MFKFTVAALFALTLPALAQSVGGSYIVAGTNPDGASYAGTAEIALDGDSCTMTWAFPNGAATGACLQVDGILATSYATDGVVTLVLYQVQADGVLNGTWRVASLPGTGTEVLTPK